MTPIELQAAIAEGEALLKNAEMFVVRFELIGSATITPDNAADVDFAVLLKNDAIVTMGEIEGWFRAVHGFQPCTEYEVTQEYEWYAIRRGYLNFMITNNEPWYERYLTAMEVAKYLKLTDKTQRINVCRIVRDGVKAAKL